jgi:hypothetical protein
VRFLRSLDALREAIAADRLHPGDVVYVPRAQLEAAGEEATMRVLDAVLSMGAHLHLVEDVSTICVMSPAEVRAGIAPPTVD